MNTYGSRLEQALQLAGRERIELANAIDVSVQAIGQVIAGKTKALTAENSAKAARFLKVDAYWLATGEGNAQGQDVPGAAPWPFTAITAEQWNALSEAQRGRVEGFAEAMLKEAAGVKSPGAPRAA
ncbi:helix-turn-helix domain-containing protein [Achromobacter xylosoxidans]|nr:helix-turn-helix transcriptional regulator [Achromobacter xylosoxidans]MCM2575131.1 helix-turn-helix domain-containing protein [Achromobacter xylosoxidans]